MFLVYNNSMFLLSLGIFLRILSNSYINVYQKTLSTLGQSSASINFYSYLGLSFFASFLLKPINFSGELLIYGLIVGILGALGNYYIIKALSLGELSSVAPINSYKPLIPLLFGFLILNEIPNINAILGISLLLLGTIYIYSQKTFDYKKNKSAINYRFLALIFSGMEAIFIKKIIVLSDIGTALFLWAVMGLIFSGLYVKFSKIKLEIKSLKFQFILIIMMAIMQYTTNYVFLKMNVAYALSLFQLSTLLSVFLGIKKFKEKGFVNKIIGSIIMVIGAIIILLN